MPAQRLRQIIEKNNIPTTKTLSEALATLWFVEGHEGLYYHRQGCRADAVVEDVVGPSELKHGTFVVAPIDDKQWAVFKRAKGIEDLLGICFFRFDSVGFDSWQHQRTKNAS